MVLAVALISPSAVKAEGPTVTGAGSTFAEVAIKQWIVDVADLGLSVSYAGVGSTQGRQQYINNKQNIDFAVTEIPFEPGEVDELTAKGISFQYSPIVAGGTAIMYHVKDTSGARITSLKLSGETLAKIFTGQIRDWNDPAIVFENPGVNIPSTKIKPVVRSDGAGTSAQFSAYLISQFGSTVGGFFGGKSSASIWPEFPGYVAQQRSDGVANFVAGNENSITYVEATFAAQRRVPVAGVKNAFGSFAKPDAAGVSLALSAATFNADGTQNLNGVYTHPDEGAYPISSYSYLVTPTAAADITEAEGQVLGGFMIYLACKGQEDSQRLGYAPLPPNVVEGIFTAIRRIPGAPEPPELNRSDCPNPSVPEESSTASTTQPTTTTQPATSTTQPATTSTVPITSTTTTPPSTSTTQTATTTTTHATTTTTAPPITTTLQAATTTTLVPAAKPSVCVRLPRLARAWLFGRLFRNLLRRLICRK